MFFIILDISNHAKFNRDADGAGLMIAGGLVVRDLHWLSFLMPGGMQPRRAASHILASTLAVQFGAVLVLTALFAGAAHFGLEHPGEKIVEQLARSSVLLIELLFATTLAVVLRAAPTVSRMWGTIAGAAVLTLLFKNFISVANWPKHVPMPLAAYLLTLLAASALLLMLANRLWTAERLFVEAGRSAH